jgi:hypothetical protein
MKLAVALLAAVVFAAGLRWGTFAVGGSDSYCYVHQAEAWASGHLQVIEPLALDAPWPDAPLTFAPAGHIPSPTVRGAAVPMCPPGLSMVMAPLVWADKASGAGEAGGLVFVVVPMFGALLIVATYMLGSRYGARVGLASALLVACSPAFLFQLMQPMSDVPATALWILAAACATRPGAAERSIMRGGPGAGPLAAGLATSAAILVRPNLLPMGIALGLFILVRPERTWRERIRDAVIFAAASAPGCIAVGIIQQMFYGSPLRSGYGSLVALFAPSHLAPNASRYFLWMWESHTPAWLIALAAPLLLPGWLTTMLLTLAVVNVACYLPYVVFNDWWYLRFMLPAITIVLVLMVAAIDAFVGRVRPSTLVGRVPPSGRSGEADPAMTRTAIVSIVTLVLCILFIREARARSVFDLQRLESRYVRAGLYVADHLPPDALVITSWESGSVRFYGHRTTLVWDGLDPAWLDRAIAFARSRGREPYLLFERWEEPNFRQRFTGSAIAALDWPPMAEIAGQVRIYRPDDRARYLRGTVAPTEYVR